MTVFDELWAPFDPSDIDWRVGSTNRDKTRGMALAYLDARAVMDRLDSVLGPANWQCRYPHANGKTVCEIGIKIDDEWVWKADGAGDTDFEPEKGALSDAFKRAAVRWGIGRYLYDLSAPWVAIEPAGKSYRIAEGEMPKLRALLKNGSEPEKPPEDEGQEDDPKDESERKILELAQFAIDKADTLQDLKVWWGDPDTQKMLRQLLPTTRDMVEDMKDRRKAEITANIISAG